MEGTAFLYGSKALLLHYAAHWRDKKEMSRIRLSVIGATFALLNSVQVGEQLRKTSDYVSSLSQCNWVFGGRDVVTHLIQRNSVRSGPEDISMAVLVPASPPRETLLGERQGTVFSVLMLI